MATQRDNSIDIWKGILVIFMVYCHVLQFFSNTEYFKMTNAIINFINVITFHSFIFCFGMTCSIAYLSKPFNKAWKKMLNTALRCYAAFVISGLAYLILAAKRIPGWYLIKNVMLLKEIPGWSEFLISFSFFILIALILFKPINILLDNKKLFWTIVPLLFLTSFLPYGKVKYNQIGLLIGTRNFASFPVLQHMPFFLVGAYIKRHSIRFNWGILLGSTGLTALSVIYMIVFNNGGLPERFPPSIFWIMLPSLFINLYYLLAVKLSNLKIDLFVLRGMGSNSLFFLVMSNIIIFSLASTGSIRVISPLVGLNYTIIILFACWLLSSFTTRVVTRTLPMKHWGVERDSL